MGIPVIHRLPDGNRAEVDSDVLGIMRRLTDGDPTVGWPGDPDLGLVWDEDKRRFEVWHTSISGDAYLVCSHSRCDADLIRLVVAADNQHASVGDRLRREKAALEAEQARKSDDWFVNEWAPKAQWAIKKDLAQHLGGRM